MSKWWQAQRVVYDFASCLIYGVLRYTSPVVSALIQIALEPSKSLCGRPPSGNQGVAVRDAVTALYRVVPTVVQDVLPWGGHKPL